MEGYADVIEACMSPAGLTDISYSSRKPTSKAAEILGFLQKYELIERVEGLKQYSATIDGWVFLQYIRSAQKMVERGPAPLPDYAAAARVGERLRGGLLDK